MKRLILIAGFALGMLALAQDIPVPCFPCDEPPPSTCSQCHTWN